jgi:dimethylhistidine N-methyltransferase
MAAKALPPISVIAADVLRGLAQTPKSLPPRLFYDDAGSALFEKITRLPEYYLTRTEKAIFRRHGSAMIDAVADGAPLTMIELGAGSAEKTGVLIASALQRSIDLHYEPVDVSRAALGNAATQLRRRWPSLPVNAIVADYTNGFRLGRSAGRRKLVLWIGSSMGNFEFAEAATILRNVRGRLDAGDMLLLGADLGPSVTKPLDAIISAYNDAAGVTAQFNLNLLARINRELGANFDLRRFRHCAEWDGRNSRMQMHLESTAPQQVWIPAFGRTFAFTRRERIHTENSYKYDPAHISALLSYAGFEITQWWTDPRRWFAVGLAHAA